VGVSERLASEEVVVAAPLSFAGSAARPWKLRRLGHRGWTIAGITACAVVLIVAAWLLVVIWYLVWTVWLVPYRLIRRGARKRRREALMHREQLQAIESLREQ
jgi:uncharacterized membrane-anchored protein